MSHTKKDWEATSRMIAQLQEAGISYEDAWSLRRISMTLQKWFEGECGNSDTYGSWAIEPDNNGDGPPFLVRHQYRGVLGPTCHTSRTPIPDRERGARLRLTKIMAKYPALKTFVQGDPKGCALYVLRPGDVPEGVDVSSCYSRGIAVHQ